jgi:hypothetical protein
MRHNNFSTWFFKKLDAVLLLPGEKAGMRESKINKLGD